MTAIADKRGLAQWETEGGSLEMATLVSLGPGRRAPQDTADGCMAMAAAGMARAAEATEGWPRIKFEHSAVAWSRRAKLLEAHKGAAGTEPH